LFLLEVVNDIEKDDKTIFVKNFQTKKSKYKIPQETFLLEKKYLYPLVKGIDIERFHLKPIKYVVPFPYESTNMRSPISKNDLLKKSKLLFQYFNKFKPVFESQTNYNEKIIGEKHNNEFYALARVGGYSFAKYYVAFRDNTKWQAVVVGLIRTPWGERKRPQFQNHAVSISQNNRGDYITLDEAHYICAIFNAKTVQNFIINSSDSRSFKIRPPINVPIFDRKNSIHLKLAKLSKEGHKYYNNKQKMKEIDIKIDKLVLELR
jgi:hypothetical protein